MSSRFRLPAPRWASSRLKYAIDVGLWVAAAPLALMVRLDTDWLRYAQAMAVYSLLGIVIIAPAIYFFGLHRQHWRTVSVRDLMSLLEAIGIGTTALLFMNLVSFSLLGVPRSIPLIQGIIAVMLLGGARLTLRLLHENRAASDSREVQRRILIIGAGKTGTMIAREMFRHPESGLTPIGFLDDDPHKQHERFLGLPVFGPVDGLIGTVQRTTIDQALIAMPSASGEAIRKVVRLAEQAGLTYRIIPAFHEILSGKASISQIREVGVEDLLRRAPIQLNMTEIASYLEGKTVLVTGAGGSIGSEIARQVAQFQPASLILLDHHETGLYYLERELERSHPSLARTSVIADIQRKDKLEQVFAVHAPQVVFHAAAHKHVPLMEENPDEAVLNNVAGTENLVEVALAHRVDRFVNISTDKAVRPTSIMGACKRMAEYIVQQAAAKARPDQIFVSVRFGNVLGSQGSVIPVFTDQIRRGGPVTVTHPDMVRYFMTVSEAAQLVLQAAGLKQTGVVYVLDMGDPVRILDLAHDLIRLSGLTPDKDIQVVFTGIRPGEKLFEEMMTDQEDVQASKYEAIFTAPQNGLPSVRFRAQLRKLYSAASSRDDPAIRRILRELIPTYHSETAASPADRS